MAAYVPPGWPASVHPPGSEGFERTAVTWLLDVVPPDYRLYGVLRRHPAALAAMAAHHMAACVEGARQAYRTTRSELGDLLPPPGIDAVLAAYRDEGSRLAETARAVDLVRRALRGEEFPPRMGAPVRKSRQARPAQPHQSQPHQSPQPGQSLRPHQSSQPHQSSEPRQSRQPHQDRARQSRQARQARQLADR